MGKKIKKEDKAPPEDVFDALLVESHQAATVVLMLESPEEDVLAKACEAIYKFVEKCDENKKVLLDLGAVDPLLRLAQCEDRIVRRNASMALGVMTAHAEVRKCLRKREEAVPAFIALLAPEEDTVVHEFAALGLSNMSADFSSKVTIQEQDGMEPLIRCLASHDPDVQKNSIEAIALMLQDYQSRTAVREWNGLEPIMHLMKSEYAIIQELALLALIRATQDAENRAALRELEVLREFIEFVGKPEYNDLHVHALHVLSNCLEDPESMEQIRESGGLQRFVAFITDVTPPEEETKKEKKKDKGKKKGDEGKGGHDKDEPGPPSNTLPEVKRHACIAIARAAKNAENRKILHETEAEKMLILLLGHEDPTVQCAAAQGLGVMCENLLSKESIGQWEGIEPLLKLIKVDNPDLKDACSLALANLTTGNMNNCHEIVNMGGIVPLIDLLSETKEGAISNSAIILTNMATDEGMRSEIQRLGVIPALIEPLKSSSTKVQSKVCLAVASYVGDYDSRVEFVEAGGLPPLIALLQSGNDEVRRSASWAVTVCSVDEKTATEIMKLGGLDILQEIQQSSTRRNGFVDAAFERLLDSKLSAKYALTGQLGSSNLIFDGFFDVGQLRPGTKFLGLEDYCKQEVNQKRPVLLINAEPEQIKDLTPSEADMMKDSSKTSVSGKTSRTGRDSKSKSRAAREREERQREEELRAQLLREEEAAMSSQPFVTPADPTLCKYIEDVQERVLPLMSTKYQVIALAEYVSDKMGGPIARGQLANFSYELPISQIKYDLKSNVIPIGLIKTGIHYHRALLFKALADRIAVSCSLMRGEYNRSWNEVMLTDDDDTPGAPKFPPKSYIVDLIHEPGRLMLADSNEAEQYKRL
ncbi:unnamed protein product [Owenia fusiformis]|uniref:EDR1/CTR1/ARMC3-like peptidase-like domain-containing protein n=1 Tax=Owenia fusiformis TaxID=6347 RepID=A0A8S4N9I7_OWEFU|nr:unnamed protein product [Owenia fusiformis]